MANLRYYNNSGPFWDFIAGLEDKDISSHPFFSAWGRQTNEDAAGPSTTREAGPSNEAGRETTTETETAMEDPAEVTPEEWSPWDGNGWGFPGRGPFMRGGRGRGGHGRGGFGRAPPHGGHGFHHGPPPPAPAGEHPPPPPHGEHPPPFPGEDDHHGPPHRPAGHEHGPHPHHAGPGAHHRGGRGGRGGRCGGRGREGPFGWKKNGMPFDMSNLAEFFQNQIFGGVTEGNTNERAGDNANGDFTPPVDIFDTEASFVVHVSLPGAKKEDIAVSWDAERSELNIAGVIYRPGDEEFLKTLALDERKVGAFSRKVRLGSRANPAAVDAEGISAKLEDGILRVNVPKEDKEFDVIHKIDIE